MTPVLDALAAGDGAGALERLLDAWRETREEELADATIALAAAIGDATTVAIRDVCAGNASEALERVQALERLPPDPRLLAAIVTWIADPPFHSTGSKPFWRAAFALLARDGAASYAKLIAAAPGLAKVKGVAMRSWLQQQLARLELARPSRPVAKDELAAVKKAVAMFEPRVNAPAPARAAAPTAEASLLAEIWAAPFDDGPRAVYADWLTDRGDPRGEFIALQLERARRALVADEAKRERVLLRKHAKQWVGEFARALPAFGMLVSAEPPAELQTVDTTYFTRGFLSRITLNGFTDRLLAKLADHPVFATVEDITCTSQRGERFAALFARPGLRALRRVRVPADLALALADGPYPG